jgi:hypothetical protein
MSEMSEHRVSMLGASWRRFEDPTRSRDPRVQAVVASLATLPAPAPSAEFRAELRAQLVAIAPRIIAESAQADTPMIEIVPRPASRPSPRPTGHPTRTAASAPPRHADSFVARLRRFPIGRPLAIAASVVTAFALLLSGAVWMSQKALPGDTLYGLKRASESLQLATASSDKEKAQDYLDFAATRAKEVSDLLSRATASAAGLGPQAGGINAGTAKRITSALASADADVTSASALLGGQAVQSKSAKPLATMTAWAPRQLSRLNQIATASPAGSLRTSAQSSADLVTAALVRARALAPQVGCSCLQSSGTDALGPIPCLTCSAPQTTPTGPTHAVTVPGGRTAPAPRSTTAALHPTPAAASGQQVQTPNAPPTPTTSETPTSGLHLPTIHLPLPTSSLPVSVKSCGLDASLGPIIIGLGLCPITIKVSLHP